jgi:hypothetical protein
VLVSRGIPAVGKNDTTKQQMEVKQQTHPQNAKFHSSKPVIFRQSFGGQFAFSYNVKK